MYREKFVPCITISYAIDKCFHIFIGNNVLAMVAACLSDRFRNALRPPLYLFSSLLCAVFAWAAWRFWYDDWQYIAEYERWSSVLALVTPLGFLLLALHFLIGGLFTPTENSEST